jgi:hypothetical protein
MATSAQDHCLLARRSSISMENSCLPSGDVYWKVTIHPDLLRTEAMRSTTLALGLLLSVTWFPCPEPVLHGRQSPKIECTLMISVKSLFMIWGNRLGQLYLICALFGACLMIRGHHLEVYHFMTPLRVNILEVNR